MSIDGVLMWVGAVLQKFGVYCSVDTGIRSGIDGARVATDRL